MTAQDYITLILAVVVSIDKLTISIAQAAEEYQARKAARRASTGGSNSGTPEDAK